MKRRFTFFDTQDRELSSIGEVIGLRIERLWVRLDPLDETQLLEVVLLHHVV